MSTLRVSSKYYLNQSYPGKKLAFATPTLVSPQNDVQGMNAEIPHLCHYPDLGSGSDWMKHKFSTNQKHWVVMCHQYGVPALIP